MRKYVFPITLLVLSFCIVFPIYPISSAPSLVKLPYGIIILLLLTVLGVFVGIQLLGMKKHYLFVCGECNLTFLTELDLRKHYAIKHTKKDNWQVKCNIGKTTKWLLYRRTTLPSYEDSIWNYYCSWVFAHRRVCYGRFSHTACNL